MDTEILLSGLSDETCPADIKKSFGRFGVISRFVLISEKVAENKLFGFVKYSHSEDAKSAVRYWIKNKLMISNQLIDVKMASELHHLIDPKLIPVHTSPTNYRTNSSYESDSKENHQSKKRDSKFKNQYQIHDRSNSDEKSKRNELPKSHDDLRSRERYKKDGTYNRYYRSRSRDNNKRDEFTKRHHQSRNDYKRFNSRHRDKENLENYPPSHHDFQSLVKKRERSYTPELDDLKNSNSVNPKLFKRESSRDNKGNLVKKECVSIHNISEEKERNLELKSDQSKNTKSEFLSSRNMNVNFDKFSPTVPENPLPVILSKYKNLQSTVIRTPSPKDRVGRYTKDNLDETWSSESLSPTKNTILKDESFEEEVGYLEGNKIDL